MSLMRALPMLEPEDGEPMSGSPQPGLSLKRPVAAALGLLGLSLGLAGLFLQSRPAASPPRSGSSTKFLTQLETVTAAEASGDECAGYPYLKYLQVESINLAGTGPQLQKGEGLKYKMLATGQGAGALFGREIYMVIHAVTHDKYEAFSPRLNGMEGKYGSINMNSDHEVDLEYTFFDRRTGDQLTLPKAAFTFFDLDEDYGGASQESVTVSGFHRKVTTKDTEVVVVDNGDGSTTFHSSTRGSGKDNPVDPLYLTAQQKNRAVSLLFNDLRVLKVKLKAGKGTGPRFFTFVGGPSLLCAVTVQLDFVPPLPDLQWEPPMDAPVIAEHNKIFVEWLTTLNARVKEGDPICKVRDETTGEETIYNAPKEGFVTALQSGLNPEEKIDMRLSEKTLAVITVDRLGPLAFVKDDDHPAAAPEGMKFVTWHVKKMDYVEAGDKICDVKDDKGTVTTVTAPTAGFVLRYMEELEPEQKIDETMTNRDMAVIGRIPPLDCNEDNGEKPTFAFDKGATFHKWIAEVGDVVPEGAPIAEIKLPSGEIKTITAEKAGIVERRQERLKEGMKIEDTLKDNDLAVIGKLPPLQPKDYEAAALTEDDDTFHKWLVETGAIVKEGDPIAEVKDKDGKIRQILAPKYGSVVSKQDYLVPGYKIEDAMKDDDIAVIGQFPELKPGWRQHGVGAPFPAGGTLPDGTVITREAWKEAVFVKWYVAMDDMCDFNTQIAQVAIPNLAGDAAANQPDISQTGRRLADAAGSAKPTEPYTVPPGMTKINITSPGWGKVVQQNPLQPGQKIGEMQVGPAIAVLEMGFPWWLALVAALCCLCCCCFPLLYYVMKKAVPPYKPMAVGEPPPAPPAPAPVPVPVVPPPSDGLRLDFKDPAGVIHTYYAKYRPLGIKHNNIAPIIAHDFTVNSYAKMDLGVQDGYKLVRIDDEELNDDDNFERVSTKLYHKLEPKLLWPLHIQFNTQADGNGQSIAKKFTRKPIGIQFTNKAPIKVDQVYPDSPASENDIQIGWFITKIGEKNILSSQNFKEVRIWLGEGVKPLDNSNKQYDLKDGVHGYFSNQDGNHPQDDTNR